MKKQLLIIAIVSLLVCVGFSGCNQISNPLTTEKTLPDGTKIIGDIGTIEIQNYQLKKQKLLHLNYVLKNLDNPAIQVESSDIPWDINTSEINQNSTLRKNICDTYFFKNSYGGSYVTWNSNYNGFVWGYSDFIINSFSSSETISSLDVSGTAKNIGNNFLDYPQVIVNFYNSNGAWLASVTASQDNILSGYTWNFDVSYDGEFRNDVSYISFEVKENL